MTKQYVYYVAILMTINLVLIFDDVAVDAIVASGTHQMRVRLSPPIDAVSHHSLPVN